MLTLWVPFAAAVLLRGCDPHAGMKGGREKMSDLGVAAKPAGRKSYVAEEGIREAGAH
jgi:hypothetical protein